MSPAESLGEIQGLESSLRNKFDIKVVTGRWEWSPLQPWPPVATVLKTPLWASDVYISERNKLLRPAPVFSITTGGQFITINTGQSPTAPAVQEGDPVPIEEPSTQEEEAQQV